MLMFRRHSAVVYNQLQREVAKMYQNYQNFEGAAVATKAFNDHITAVLKLNALNSDYAEIISDCSYYETDLKTYRDHYVGTAPTQSQTQSDAYNFGAMRTACLILLDDLSDLKSKEEHLKHSEKIWYPSRRSDSSKDQYVEVYDLAVDIKIEAVAGKINLENARLTELKQMRCLYREMWLSIVTSTIEVDDAPYQKEIDLMRKGIRKQIEMNAKLRQCRDFWRNKYIISLYEKGRQESW